MLVYTKNFFSNFNGLLKADGVKYKNEAINYSYTKSESEKMQRARLKWAFSPCWRTRCSITLPAAGRRPLRQRL